jgi:hypothetical protein
MVKLIMLLATWKCHLIYKYRSINPQQFINKLPPKPSISREANMTKMSSKSKVGRPAVNKSPRSSNLQLPLRYLESSELSI